MLFTDRSIVRDTTIWHVAMGMDLHLLSTFLTGSWFTSSKVILTSGSISSTASLKIVIALVVRFRFIKKMMQDAAKQEMNYVERTSLALWLAIVTDKTIYITPRGISIYIVSDKMKMTSSLPSCKPP